MEYPNVEQLDYKGYIIKIVVDKWPESPLEGWHNLGTIITTHHRLNLGHIAKPNYTEWCRTVLDQVGVDIDQFESRYETLENRIWHRNPTVTEANKNARREYNKLFYKALDKVCIYLPVYLYNHSRLIMRTTPFSCPWDSGQVGIILVLLDTVRKEYGKRITRRVRETVEGVLRSEVDHYSQYLEGRVYGWVVEDQEEVHIDSCYGYYAEHGDKEWKYMIQCAKDCVDQEIKKNPELPFVGTISEK